MAPHDPGEHQEELFEPGQELGDDAPLLYIATPLSHLDDEEDRQHVQLLAHTVHRGVQDYLRESGESWQVKQHLPIKSSAPWGGDERDGKDVYELNSSKLSAEADALVMVAFRGGSIGMGQELAWAGARSIPVLYLHPKNANVSRQIEGMRSEYELTIEEYDGPESIGAVVGHWLLSRRATISDGPRRRRGLALRYVERQRRLAETWRALPVEEQAKVIAVTGLLRGRIERMLSDPLMLAAASVREVGDLAAAMSLEATGELFSRPLPELRAQQLQALSFASAEFEWDYETALDLHTKARVELARGGIRRLPLASSQDWETFHRHHYGT
jgi:hypothetical protein